MAWGSMIIVKRGMSSLEAKKFLASKEGCASRKNI